MLRIAAAAVVSFLIVLLLGPKVIRMLMRRKLGDRPEFDHANLNELTKHKSNTPTMGGVLIVLAIFLSVALFSDIWSNMYIKGGLFMLAWMSGLGACDDWLKLHRKPGSSDGLVMWQKLIFQIAGAVMVSIAIWSYSNESFIKDPSLGMLNPAHSLYLPFVHNPVTLSKLAYVVVAVLIIVGSSNAVNLTDGMDGLASGCTVIVSTTFLVLLLIAGVPEFARQFMVPFVVGSKEMMVFCAAIIGACLGFLWYNAHPAQVFMGDTGSLPLGGLLGYIALVTRYEVLLLIAGGVFFMEALSVILQVSYFKHTKRKNNGEGKRLFRCAPLHHHFHLGGWAETKVVIRFWIMGIIFAALALATLKLR